MTIQHDKALQAAANELLAHGEFGTFEEANRRNAVSAAGAAISAYLSSIGGIVCAREPAGYVTEVELAQLKFGVSCVDLFGTVAFKDFKLVPLHAPIPEAGNGGDGWLDISSAPKNQKVLVAYQNDLGNWRIVTACYHTQLEWSDEYGDHEQEYAPEDWYEENDSSEVIYPTSRKPTHWRPLPPPPSPSNEGEKQS